MKSIRVNCAMLLLFLLPGLATAGITKGKYTKEKKISKSFTVSATAGLTVANKYGNIYITTWDENTTAIDISVIVSSDKEDDAVKRINSIDVEFDATPSLVAAKTIIGNFRGRKISMEINYTIKIPKRGTLGLSNQYGNIKLGAINGGVNINCQYGNVDVEALNSDNNSIVLEYASNSSAGYINGATINAQYSGLNIAKSKKLTAKCEYTDLKIGDVDNITYKAEYGSVVINNAAIVIGSGDYLTVKLGNIENQVNLTGDYNNMTLSLGNGAKNTAINGDYTNISLKYDSNYAFDFEFDITYGNATGTGDFITTQKRVKDNHSYSKGYYKTSGINKIYFSSDYGNIKMTKL